MEEASISLTNSFLLFLSNHGAKDAKEIRDNFCGQVLDYTASSSIDGGCHCNSSPLPSFSNKTVYVCGDLTKIDKVLEEALQRANQVFIIRQLSHGFDDLNKAWPVVDQGRLPLSVHGVGVFYRRYFSKEESSDHCYNRIVREHQFQSLTESTKPSAAHRTGVYLTPVFPSGDALHFRLLRCSSNFEGPTLNFAPTDHMIVGSLNREAGMLFDDTAAPLNHVLAQIYHNKAAATIDGKQQKQFKAKIKEHSDKTKDMPSNGIMAFCTFYDGLGKLKPLANDPYDYGRKTTSGLTKLIFRLKQCMVEKQANNNKYVSEFSITLYPDSVFLMPLSTNRLYTHEIKPGQLPPEELPTRMGYVVRCSSTEAVFCKGKTHLKKKNSATGAITMEELQEPTKEGMADLRRLYAEENRTADYIDYGDKFQFSMNQGDYLRPEYSAVDEFPSYCVSSLEGKNLYEQLLSSVEWEDVGKGRKGSVLVKPDAEGWVPIVRTTTKYAKPAHLFKTIHQFLAQQIEGIASLPFGLNNALIEHYTPAYRKMGMHSDQALDLMAGSHVAVYSCYKHPDLPANRKLVVESKADGNDKEMFEIPLLHNHVVVFSLDTNQRFRHKIVLSTIIDDDCGTVVAPSNINEWLGVTFRTSDAHVQYRQDDGGAFFRDGRQLTVVEPDDAAEAKEFRKLRSRENKEIGFSYPPDLAITVSESDAMPPV